MRICAKDPRAVQLRTFVCLSCGAKVTLTKRLGKTKAGHVKTTWCYRCKAVTDHMQLD